MNQKSAKKKPVSTTGPLATPAELGQFTYRDGAWYLQPSPHTIKQPLVN